MRGDMVDFGVPSVLPITELRTARLRLRRLRPEDAPWMAALLADPDVTKFIPGERRTEREVLQQAEERIALDQASPHFGWWAVEDLGTGQVHGWVALKPLSGTDEIEIGFRLRPSSWGRGIATEAAACLLEYGFGQLGLERIVAVTVVGNAAAARVLAKLGLRREKCVAFDSVEWDNFALSRDEWRATVR